MSGFKCNNCDHEFDQSKYIKDEEIIDYGIGSVWATLWEGEVCPYCESNDFEKHSTEEENQHG